MRRRGIFDVVEGFYTSHAVWALHRLGALSRLHSRMDISNLAEQFGCDEEQLKAVVDYLYRTTDLLKREGNRYELSPEYRAYSNSVGFHLDKFLGAYGPPIVRFTDVLTNASAGSVRRNSKALAEAFAQLVPHRPSLTARVLQTWNATSLLDLGCGVGTLLIELAEADPTFEGWGIDSNPDMVKISTQRIQSASLGTRIHVAQGDVRTLDKSTLGRISLEKISFVYARSVINEFFADGGQGAITALGHLKRLLPGRVLLIEDYSGRLTSNQDVAQTHHHTLLQDLAQVVSGQGIPPPTLSGWARIYAAAECDLLKAYEGDNDGIIWFIHALRL